MFSLAGKNFSFLGRYDKIDSSKKEKDKEFGLHKYIVEPEYDGYEIGEYLKETKGYSGRGLRKLEIYLNGKKIKNTAKKFGN